MDSALQWKNLYPSDNAIGLVRITQLPVRTGRGSGGGGDRHVKWAGRLVGRLGLNPAWPKLNFTPKTYHSGGYWSRGPPPDTILVTSKMRAIAKTLSFKKSFPLLNFFLTSTF